MPRAPRRPRRAGRRERRSRVRPKPRLRRSRLSRTRQQLHQRCGPAGGRGRDTLQPDQGDCPALRQPLSVLALPLGALEHDLDPRLVGEIVERSVFAQAFLFVVGVAATEEHALDIALQRLFMEKTQGTLAADFMFISFPPQFRLPFLSGEDVSALKHLPTRTTESPIETPVGI